MGKIVPALIRKREMPDGSIFDTTWLIFLHHMAYFYALIGSSAARMCKAPYALTGTKRNLLSLS
jgi:hypothetical protein